MRLELGTPNHQLQDGSATWNAAISPALTMWNQQMQRAHLVGVVHSPAPPSSGDRVNSVVFASTIFGQSFGSGTLAVTYYTSQGASLIQADVLLNSARHFDSYRGPLQFSDEIRRVFLHELGHVLGLDHPDSAGQHVSAIMNSAVSDLDTLSADDIHGIQSLYGAPAAPSTPNLLWQNDETGERQIWLMDGTVHTTTSNLGVLSTQWNMVASADFDGDGKIDIVWQYSVTGHARIWLMHGTTHVASVDLPELSPDWEIVSASDFNGDGQADLLLQSNLTGQRAIWLMNRTTFASSVDLGTIARDWKIKGSGDFSGDGKADILWQNDATGQRLIWIMNRTSHTGNVSLGTIARAWDIAGTGDFNGDGKRDILLQNSATGQRLIWIMNRTSHTSNVSLGVVPSEWDIRNH